MNFCGKQYNAVSARSAWLLISGMLSRSSNTNSRNMGISISKAPNRQPALSLVDHLTNHQLETLAQELNETKLKIIVPILNEDQLGSLVRGFRNQIR